MTVSGLAPWHVSHIVAKGIIEKIRPRIGVQITAHGYSANGHSGVGIWIDPVLSIVTIRTQTWGLDKDYHLGDPCLIDCIVDDINEYYKYVDDINKYYKYYKE